MKLPIKFKTRKQAQLHGFTWSNEYGGYIKQDVIGITRTLCTSLKMLNEQRKEWFIYSVVEEGKKQTAYELSQKEI